MQERRDHPDQGERGALRRASAAGSRKLHGFSQEDVNFMQAIANVLANAIERRRTEEQTQHEALHDPLTGLPEPQPLPRPPAARPLGGGPRARSRSRCSSSTSTSSSSSTTASGTRPATSCWPPSPRGSSRPCARATPSPASAATSSRCSPRTSASERGATRIAERIAEALARPFILREREHFVSASIGIAIGGGHRGARGPDPRRRLGPLPRQGARPRRLRDLRRGDALPRDRAHADRERPAACDPARGAASSTTSRWSGSATARSSRWRRCCAGTIPSAA